MTDLEHHRYPIGRFERCAEPVDAGTHAALIDVIEQTPKTIRGLVERLTDARLDTPYRDGGWTIRQVVHHLPDSHMRKALQPMSCYLCSRLHPLVRIVPDCR